MCQQGFSLEALWAQGYSAPRRVSPSSCKGDSRAVFLQHASPPGRQVQETQPRTELSIQRVKAPGKKTVSLHEGHLAKKLSQKLVLLLRCAASALVCTTSNLEELFLCKCPIRNLSSCLLENN